MNKTHSALIVFLLLIISSCIFYQTIIIHNNQQKDNAEIVFKDYINDKKIEVVEVEDKESGSNQKTELNNYSVRQATHMGGHLRNPKPPYPPLSLENGEQGTVSLLVMIEPDGRPSNVQLAKSSGYRELDNSALETVRDKYKFEPAIRNGVPIRAMYTFNIVFEIE